MDDKDDDRSDLVRKKKLAVSLRDINNNKSHSIVIMSK